MKKGFTIIELIVVIAIIAILAAIVMVNVTKYISNAKASAIKANLSTLPTSAVGYAQTNNGSYANFCSSDEVNKVHTAVDNINSGFGCGNNETPGCEGLNGWYAYGLLPDSTYWCVDSKGFSGLVGNPGLTIPIHCDCSLWVD